MLKTITGTYDLVPNSSWNDLQTEEIRLVCDTTSAPVVVNLPQISSIVGGTLNVKIYVVDGAGNAATNNITINPGGSNKIGASTSYVINVNNGGSYIQIGSPTNWLLTPNNTIGGGGSGGAGSLIIYQSGTNQSQAFVIIDNNVWQETINVDGIKELYSSNDLAMQISSLSDMTKVINIKGMTVFKGGFKIDQVTDYLEEINFPDLITLGACNSAFSNGFSILNSSGNGLKKITMPKLKEFVANVNSQGISFKVQSPVFEGLSLPELTDMKFDYAAGAMMQSYMYFMIGCVGGMSIPKLALINGADGTANGGSLTFGIGGSSATGDVVIGSLATPFDVTNFDQIQIMTSTENATSLKFYVKNAISNNTTITIYDSPSSLMTSIDFSTLEDMGTNGNLSVSVGNNVTTLDFSKLVRTGQISISGNSFLTNITLGNSLNCLNIDLSGNALSQSSVNAILVAIDTAGYSNGTLNLGAGTNSAPSGAGSTAKTSLQGKGWTVTTN
jgi:hypothetical protein